MQENTYINFKKYKEDGHWFEVGRNKIFASILDKLINGQNLNILDIGCGTGEMMEYFKKFGRVSGIEKHWPYAEICRKKGFEVKDISIEDMSLDGESFDIVSFFDVLEHIEGDVAALNRAYRLLNSGGLVVISMPAFPVLWGPSDIIGQHKRRYRKKEVKRKLENAGFNIIKLTYFNHFLFPLIFPFLLAKRILTFNNLIKTRSSHEYFNGASFVSGLLKAVLFKEAEILKNHDFMFGLSLFAVGKK